MIIGTNLRVVKICISNQLIKRDIFLKLRHDIILRVNLYSPLAGFSETQGLKVLEIGIGLGADHQKFAEAGAYLWGIDLTERSVEQTSFLL